MEGARDGIGLFIVGVPARIYPLLFFPFFFFFSLSFNYFVYLIFGQKQYPPSAYIHTVANAYVSILLIVLVEIRSKPA